MKSDRSWLVRFALSTPLAAIPAFLSRTGIEPGTTAAGRALETLVAFTLPLLVCILLHSMTSPRFEERVAGAVRFGASRRRLVLSELAERALALLVATSLLTVALLVFARSATDPELPRDLLVTLPATTLGAAAAFSLLGAAALWAGRVGLYGALFVVWTIGHLQLPIAAAVPVGHLRHLLGLGAALPFAQWISSAALAGFAALFAVAAFVRVPR